MNFWANYYCIFHIIPKPELRSFLGKESFTKPPFGVNNELNELEPFFEQPKSLGTDFFVDRLLSLNLTIGELQW